MLSQKIKDEFARVTQNVVLKCFLLSFVYSYKGLPEQTINK